MSGSHERDDERPGPSVDPEGAEDSPNALKREFLDSIATGHLDAKVVFDALADEGVLTPGLLTQLREAESPFHLVDAGALTEGISVPSAPRADRGSAGRFEEVGLLGQGGMGKVVEALDPDLRRKVAVKSILARSRSTPEVRQKFLAEAQITGQLEHPNIIPVHEMGRGPDGEIYFSMKKVEGLHGARILGFIRH